MQLSFRWPSPFVCLTAFIAIYCAVFISASVARFYGLESEVLDLGVFDQIYWSILHTGSPLSTLNEPYIQRHWLGFHFSPLLYAMLPFYALAPRPETLLILNVVLLALSAIPLYFTARCWHIAPPLALLWCITFLVNPFIQSAVIWDFHEIALATPIMATALYAIASRKRVLLVITALLLLLCKEQYGINVAGLGMVWAFAHKQWRQGLSMSILGIAAFLMVIFIIMPSFHSTGALPDPHARFAWITHIRNLPPQFVIAMVCVGVIYLGIVLGLFWLVPLYACIWLLPASGDIVINLLSAHEFMRSIYAYHTASAMPAVIAASMQGAKAMARKRGTLGFTALTIIITITNLVVGYLAAPLPLPGADNLWEVHLQNLSHPQLADITCIHALLPDDASLSVQSNIGSFFTQRRHVYDFPGQLTTVNAVVLHVQTPYRKSGSVFNSPFQLLAPEYIATVRSLLADNTWHITYWHNHWLVLQKNKPAIAVDRSEIESDLQVIETTYAQASHDPTR